MIEKTPVPIPTLEEIEKERSRIRYKSRYQRTLRSTVAVLIVVAALSVLVATLWMLLPRRLWKKKCRMDMKCA